LLFALDEFFVFTFPLTLLDPATDTVAVVDDDSKVVVAPDDGIAVSSCLLEVREGTFLFVSFNDDDDDDDNRGGSSDFLVDESREGSPFILDESGRGQ